MFLFLLWEGDRERANEMMNRFALHIITPDLKGKNCFKEVMAFAEIAIKSRSSVFQFRNKTITGKAFYYFAIELKKLFNLFNNDVENSSVLFIVNDRADIAYLAGADGVHIGDGDIPLSSVKKIFPRLITGASVSNPDEAIKAEKEGADYVGAGPVFSTLTKTDAGEPIGLDMLKKICHSVKIPVVAIGGIKTGNLANVFRAGAKGVAIITAISESKDPLSSAIEMRKIIQKLSKKCYY